MKDSGAADIAVIGAGVAGLACAGALQAAGARVVVLDKGRGPGGRVSTRRAETPLGEVSFDHGAQFLTVRDPAFADRLAPLIAAGRLAPWDRPRVRFEGGRAVEAPAERAYVGRPGMNALPRGLAEGLDVRCGAAAAELVRGAGGWRVLDGEGAVLARAATVIIATPAEQAAPLLRPHAPGLAAEAAAARTAPTWAVMALYAGSVPAPFPAAAFAEGPLGWVSRQRAEGLDGAEAWVLHASQAWSAAHLEAPPEQIAEALTAAFSAGPFAAPAPIWTAAHRWRYAFVAEAAATPCAWAPPLGLGVCGDWRIGPRIEAAFLSGLACARAVTASPAHP